MNEEGGVPDGSDSSLFPHPSLVSLHALSLGQLSETELAPILDHLGGCPECCGRMEALTASDSLVTRLQHRAARREEALVSPSQRRSAVRVLLQARESGANFQVRSRIAAPVILPPPRQVGDYEILAEVGRGGMGVVFKARHRGLQRLTALKMVLAGEFASPTQELRFRLEAELAARVQHSNIVQVYEISTYEGRPFLAMEWVEGGSLADRLDTRPWAPDQAAALVETLALAIDKAHSEGIVHRDLKPGNILLQKVDSRLHTPDSRNPTNNTSPMQGVDQSKPTYCVKITDFGLAQTIEGGQTMTQSGFLVGTPGYMAPEQAGGKRAQVGPATDIYALGVVLYELLTGRLPFQGDSALEVLRAVTSDEPTRPRRLQPRVPRDLEAITLHCLEKEPSRRYASAHELAQELRRFREGKQVLARPVGGVARLARACRRRPLVALLLALLTVSLFGGLGGVTWKWLEADEQRDLANAHAREADDEKQTSQHQAYRASLAAASAALENHDTADAARNLKAAPEALRGWEWRHLSSRLDDSASVIHLPIGIGASLLAAPDRLRVGVLTDAGLRITDLGGGEQTMLSTGSPLKRAVDVTQTRRGLRLAAWDGPTAFDLLDETGRVLCRVTAPNMMGPAVVSPDGTRLACWLDNLKRIGVFDAVSGKQTAICAGHPESMCSLSFSPDSTRLASGSEDRTARLWDAATGSLLATCRGHTSKVLRVTFSPDGKRLATASSDGTVRQWDPRTGQKVEAPYDRHANEVYAVAYSPDGKWIASAGFDRAIRVWQAEGQQDVAVLHGHTGRVSDVTFAPDGRSLVSLSWRSQFVAAGDDTLRVWDVDPRASLPVLHGHTSYVYPVTFSPDGRWLASGSWDKTVRLWDAVTGEPCAILNHPAFVMSLAFGPDGSWLVTGCHNDARLRIWDVATGRVRREIPYREKNLNSLTLSPDGSRVAATSLLDLTPRTLRLTVMDAASGQSLFSREGAALSYSPDGRWLAVVDADDRTVLLLDAQTHELAARFSGHTRAVFKAAFSPDSSLLATCSEDHSVRLWEISSGACRVLNGHSDEVFAVAFHPDGTRLATAGRDGAVWLWDVARAEEVARLPGSKSYVWSLAFSRDGATLASGSGDTTIRLWDTEPLKMRYQARRAAAALRPEAERLVEQLWRTKPDPAEVVSALRTDRALSEELRQAALLAVLRRTQPPEGGAGSAHDSP